MIKKISKVIILAVIVVITLLTLSPAHAQTKYIKYTNTRFGFSIDRPAHFLENPIPANNDGRSFETKDQTAELIVFGSHDILVFAKENNFKSYFESVIKQITGKITSKKFDEKSFTLTWSQEGENFYRKTYNRHDSTVTFIFSYPSNEQHKYADMIKHIESGFKPGIDK